MVLEQNIVSQEISGVPCPFKECCFTVNTEDIEFVHLFNIYLSTTALNQQFNVFNILIAMSRGKKNSDASGIDCNTMKIYLKNLTLDMTHTSKGILLLVVILSKT